MIKDILPEERGMRIMAGIMAAEMEEETMVMVMVEKVMTKGMIGIIMAKAMMVMIMAGDINT